MGEKALRDHFAGLAMQGLIQSRMPSEGEYPLVSKMAYDLADAMLKEREKKEDGGGDE
tara:strand:- start:259 stop:432 length:174 start_codon:yes stop_codon:yes gene_type:complete